MYSRFFVVAGAGAAGSIMGRPEAEAKAADLDYQSLLTRVVRRQKKSTTNMFLKRKRRVHALAFSIDRHVRY